MYSGICTQVYVIILDVLRCIYSHTHRWKAMALLSTWQKLNEKAIYANNSVIEYVQVVRWPIGSKQNPHYDRAQDYTTLASIIYLNDNFIGGETYFTDGIIFTPRQGRLILFDGQYFEHGVSDINTNERYVVAAWYKNNSKKENYG